MDERIDNTTDRIANNVEAATFGLPSSEMIGGAPTNKGGQDDIDGRITPREIQA
jgi:hypothetical protein